MARVPGRTIGGKTGTTNDGRDVWFVGGTPDLVVGVFMGYDQPRSLGNNATGGLLAAPIFQAFMEQALKGQRDIAFRVPDGVSFVRVNRFTGRRATAADSAANIVLEAFRSGTEGVVDDGAFSRSGQDSSNALSVNFDGIY